MPHGSCANRNGVQPRMAQLLTMFPHDGESTFKTINAVKEEAKRDWGGVLPSNRHIADADEAAQLEWERSRRVTMWRLGLDVHTFDAGWASESPFHTEGFGGARDLAQAPPAVLTELGKRLVGVSKW